MAPAASSPYSLPQELEPELNRLLAYWKDLLRGENAMPFSDDINLSAVPELTGRTILMSAFENPERFRFEAAGDQVATQYGAPLKGEFSDEIQSRPPLDQLTEQCSATVSLRSPTYFRSADKNGGYARLLLPSWGDGHVALLLGAVTGIRK